MREHRGEPAVNERPRFAGKTDTLTVRRTDTGRRGTSQAPIHPAVTSKSTVSGGRKKRKKLARQGVARSEWVASPSRAGEEDDISTQHTQQLSQRQLQAARNGFDGFDETQRYAASEARDARGYVSYAEADEAHAERRRGERLRTFAQAHWRSLALFIAALFGGVFAPWLIALTPLPRHTQSFLLALDFDPERILFINQLMVVALGTVLVGMLFRQRIATILGAILYFVVAYLVPFVAQAQHPSLSLGGLPQTLIPGALPRLAVSLLALGIISAALGTLVGSAYGELALVSTGKLFLCIQQAIQQRTAAPLKRSGMPLALLTLGIVIIVAALIGANQAGSVLTDGLTTNLYQTSLQGHTLLTGTVEQLHYTSPTLGGITRTCYVYLPPSYSHNTSERYPVFYLLHGSPGGPATWFAEGRAATNEDTLLTLGKVRETIIVGADGRGPVYQFSEWANSLDGRQRMEDAIAFDLVHFIDTHFRTLADPADRAIGGLSEGGFGAPNIALHHPDIFGNVMSVGGYFHASIKSPVFIGPDSSAYRAYNSPLVYLFTPSGSKAAHQIHFVIGVGTQDGALYQDGLAFYQALIHAKVHAQLIITNGGHSWGVWESQFATIFPMLEPPYGVPAAT